MKIELIKDKKFEPFKITLTFQTEKDVLDCIAELDSFDGSLTDQLYYILVEQQA